MLHRIEMEKQEAEWFVLDCLWQRLGQSFEDCSVILPFKEYDLWRKRQDMIHTVDSGQFKLAYERIQAYQDVIRGRNKLHAQLLGYFIYFRFGKSRGLHGMNYWKPTESFLQ